MTEETQEQTQETQSDAEVVQEVEIKNGIGSGSRKMLRGSGGKFVSKTKKTDEVLIVKSNQDISLKRWEAVTSEITDFLNGHEKGEDKSRLQTLLQKLYDECIACGSKPGDLSSLQKSIDMLLSRTVGRSASSPADVDAAKTFTDSIRVIHIPSPVLMHSEVLQEHEWVKTPLKAPSFALPAPGKEILFADAEVIRQNG